jgi:hypothetical protein
MIYFIQAAESKRIKIGFSASNPAHRRNTMQVGCPEELELLFHMDEGRDVYVPPTVTCIRATNRDTQFNTSPKASNLRVAAGRVPLVRSLPAQSLRGDNNEYTF